MASTRDTFVWSEIALDVNPIEIGEKNMEPPGPYKFLASYPFYVFPLLSL
jgi:hypothetical protein